MTVCDCFRCPKHSGRIAGASAFLADQSKREELLRFGTESSGDLKTLFESTESRKTHCQLRQQTVFHQHALLAINRLFESKLQCFRQQSESLFDLSRAKICQRLFG